MNSNSDIDGVGFEIPVGGVAGVATRECFEVAERAFSPMARIYEQHVQDIRDRR